MIPTIPFAIGFVVYVAFMLTTFKTYSMKQEMTKGLSLIMIYVFYTFLAAYVINFVDGASGSFVVAVEVAIYALAGGFVAQRYYLDNIKKIDDDLYGQNV